MATPSYFTFSPSPSTYGKLSRRCLTPSCVSPPAVTTYSSRPELNRSQTSPKASTLLSKVALVSTSSTRGGSTATAPTSPLPGGALLSEKETRDPLKNSYRDPQTAEHAEKRQNSEVEQFQYRGRMEQRDGYISFPDFDRYCQGHGQPEENDEQDRPQQT